MAAVPCEAVQPRYRAASNHSRDGSGLRMGAPDSGASLRAKRPARFGNLRTTQSFRPFPPKPPDGLGAGTRLCTLWQPSKGARAADAAFHRVAKTVCIAVLYGRGLIRDCHERASNGLS